jgi:hypothetical protein
MFQHPLFKIPFRYGVIGGVIASIVIASLYYMGQHPFLVPWVVDFRLVFFTVFIFLSLKEARDYHLGGNLSFAQGMIASYVFIGTSGVIGAVFTWCFAKWNPDFLQSYILKMTEEMKSFQKEIEQSFDAQKYQQQLIELQSTSGFTLASDYFLKSLIIGLFLTIIISIILRKQTQTQT